MIYSVKNPTHFLMENTNSGHWAVWGVIIFAGTGKECRAKLKELIKKNDDARSLGFSPNDPFLVTKKEYDRQVNRFFR